MAVNDMLQALKNLTSDVPILFVLAAVLGSLTPRNTRVAARAVAA